MMFGRRPTVDELLAGHEFANDETFRASLQRALQDNPHRRAQDMLFVCTAIYRVTRNCDELLHKGMAAATATERGRVAAIITYGIQNDDLVNAVNVALTTDLDANDAIAILRTRDSGAPVKPS